MAGGGRQQWLGSGYILKTEPTRFPKGLDEVRALCPSTKTGLNLPAYCGKEKQSCAAKTGQSLAGEKLD